MFVSACLRGRMSLKGHMAVQLQDSWRQGSNPESLSQGSSFNQTLSPARKTWSLPARGFWQGWKTQITFTKEPGMIAGRREPRNNASCRDGHSVEGADRGRWGCAPRHSPRSLWDGLARKIGRKFPVGEMGEGRERGVTGMSLCEGPRGIAHTGPFQHEHRPSRQAGRLIPVSSSSTPSLSTCSLLVPSGDLCPQLPCLGPRGACEGPELGQQMH